MSKAPLGQKIPPILQTVTNVQFNTRVADLFEKKPTAPIVGHSPNGGVNQQWYFNRLGSGHQYTISTMALDGAEVAFANTPEPTPGETVFGNAVGTVYNVDQVSPPFVFTISIVGGGQVLYWTLGDGAESTPITLQAKNGTDNQFWMIRDVGSH